MVQAGSFIPKQTKATDQNRHKVRKIYVFTYISYVIFFGTLLTVGAMFLYDLQLQKTLQNQKALLADERSRFSDTDMDRVRGLEKRLVTAESVLGTHAQISSVLVGLEKVTASRVQFDDFALTRQGGVFAITLKGATNSFDPLIAQRQAMAGDKFFADAVVKGISFKSETSGEGSTSSQSPQIVFDVAHNFTVKDIPNTESKPVINEEVSIAPGELADLENAEIEAVGLDKQEESVDEGLEAINI